MSAPKRRSKAPNAKAPHTARARDTGAGAWKRKLRRQLFAGRKRVPCCFCGCLLSFRKATLEHVVPRSQGGPWTVENLKLSCAQCNNERGATEFGEFRRRKEQACATR